tara:strand:+ start:599 stop:877 length:279 start_codon:yes stop_codon:yes gene_type:complete
MLNLENQKEKYSYMNKRQKQHKSILSGNANAVSVVDKDLGYALRLFKRKIKDANILDRFKENKTFTKRSVKRKEQINKAKYIQKIKDIQNNF